MFIVRNVIHFRVEQKEGKNLVMQHQGPNKQTNKYRRASHQASSNEKSIDL